MVSSEPSEENTGTEGARKARNCPWSWESIFWTGSDSRGCSPRASSLPPLNFHPPSGYFSLLKWLFAGRLAEGGTGFKCI